MNVIELKNFIVEKNKIKYEFNIPSTLDKYFNKKYDFFIEYPENIDLNFVPDAVLAVPFVTNLMILSAVEPVAVKVKEIDKAFYECIPDLNKGFKKIYSYYDFSFNVIADKTVDCSYEPAEKYTQFFTGGVDATSAFITNLGKRPELINIWGGDIVLENKDRYDYNAKYFKDLCGEYGLNFSSIRSSLRFMYNEPLLDAFIKDKIGTTWWAGISHNICMCSLVAPYAYIKKIKTHYIASTYSENQNIYPGCNYSFINNVFRFSSCTISHTDTYLTRDDKIQNIKDFYDKYQKSFYLYVCHSHIFLGNCNSCEKCYRTIIALIEKRLDPNCFGFKVDSKIFKKIKRLLQTRRVIPNYWVKMQEDFLENKDFWKKVPEMKWFLHIKINSPYMKYKILYIKVGGKIKSILVRLLKKLNLYK